MTIVRVFRAKRNGLCLSVKGMVRDLNNKVFFFLESKLNDKAHHICSKHEQKQLSKH